jgi:hypothetical protein
MGQTKRNRAARVRAAAALLQARANLPEELKKNPIVTGLVSAIINEILGCWASRSAEKSKQKLIEARERFDATGKVPLQVRRVLRSRNCVDPAEQRQFYADALSTTEDNQEEILPLLTLGDED